MPKNYFRAKKIIQALLLINSLQSFDHQLISPRILSPLEMDIRMSPQLFISIQMFIVSDYVLDCIFY